MFYSFRIKSIECFGQEVRLSLDSAHSIFDHEKKCFGLKCSIVSELKVLNVLVILSLQLFMYKHPF